MKICCIMKTGSADVAGMQLLVTDTNTKQEVAEQHQHQVRLLCLNLLTSQARVTGSSGHHGATEWR